MKFKLGGGTKKTVHFIFSHIWKLLKQYWIIVMPFALLGMVTGWRTVYDVYGNNFIGKLITDLFGLNYLIYGVNSSNLYNAACWYIGVAILFFMLTPFFCWLMKKNPILLLGVSMLLGYDNLLCDRLLIGKRIGWYYFLAFVIGMFLSKYGILDKIKSMKKDGYYVLGSTCLVLAIAAVRYRHGIVVDGFFALSIIIFMLGIIDVLPKAASVVGLIGKQSTTIFMMHSFVCTYYFSGFIYGFKWPSAILVVLLLVCIAYSIILENITFHVKNIR